MKVYLFLGLLVTVACTSSRADISEQKILKIIANPQTTTNKLIHALQSLKSSKQTNEPATFWTTIANNPTYSWDHRRRAVLQLFARHFHQGMTFGDVGKLLDHANWIDPHCINVSSIINGPQPPNIGDNDSQAHVSVGPCHPFSVELIFVTRNDSVGLDDHLYDCLTGKPTTAKLAHLRIQAVISDERISGNDVYNFWGIAPK